MEERAFTPKIIKWGRKFGATNDKWGRFVKIYQKGAGKNNNSSSKKRWMGKEYKNAKQDRLSRRGNVTFGGITRRRV